jgi:hypothetical protein
VLFYFLVTFIDIITMKESNCPSCHRDLIKPGVEKNEQHLNIDYNFDQQMSLSKSKCWYWNNCLHFLKRSVPLFFNAVWPWDGLWKRPAFNVELQQHVFQLKCHYYILIGVYMKHGLDYMIGSCRADGAMTLSKMTFNIIR